MFMNSWITHAQLVYPPIPQSTAPFGYSRPPPSTPEAALVPSQPPHAAVTRHSSDPRTREFEAKSLSSPLTQHTAVTRSNWRECMSCFLRESIALLALLTRAVSCIFILENCTWY